MSKSLSISSNIIAGFLLRNFEINNYTFEISESSFIQTYNELINFFQKEEIEVDSFLSLHGPTGDIEEILLDESASIKKADYELAKLFNRYYSTTDGFYVDMFEGDYVLKLRYKCNKKDFLRLQQIEGKMLEKYFLATLLSGVGNIERGKVVRQSAAWPLVTIRTSQSFYYCMNSYSNFEPPSFYYTK